jgi:hypothetical protein
LKALSLADIEEQPIVNVTVINDDNSFLFVFIRFSFVGPLLRFDVRNSFGLGGTKYCSQAWYVETM